MALEVLTDGTQAVGSNACEQGHRFQIAVDACSHKVIGAEVPDFQKRIRHHIGNIHKLAGIVGGRDLYGLGALATCRHGD